MYQVLLKRNGRWQEVARGFDSFDGATTWVDAVMDAREGLDLVGYQIRDASGKIVCSVEVTA